LEVSVRTCGELSVGGTRHRTELPMGTEVLAGAYPVSFATMGQACSEYGWRFSPPANQIGPVGGASADVSPAGAFGIGRFTGTHDVPSKWMAKGVVAAAWVIPVPTAHTSVGELAPTPRRRRSVPGRIGASLTGVQLLPSQCSMSGRDMA